MRAKQTLQRGLAIMRRHAIVSIVVLAVVVAAGLVYVRGQVPTYRATAKLLVERRASSSSRDLPEAVSFMEDATYSATQRYLLKHDETLAREVLESLDQEDRSREAVAALLAGIKVETEAGTLVVNLSFEGPKPEDAIDIVNAYADAYVDKNRDERVIMLKDRLTEVGQLYRDAEALESEAARALDSFRLANSDVAFTTGENPHQGLAQLLAEQVTADEMRMIDLGREELEILSVLARHEIQVIRNDAASAPGSVRIEMEAGVETLETRLRTETDLLGLPAVSRSDNVSDLRAKARNLTDQYHQLRLELTERNDKVKEVLRRIEENESELGAQIHLTIERFLREVEAVRVHLSEVGSRHEEVSARARKTNELLAEYGRLSQAQATAAAAAAALLERRTELEKVTDTDDALTRKRLESISVFKPAHEAPLVRPNRPLIYLLTAMAAIFLSIGSALLLGYLDDTIKSREDFDRQFRDRLPFIGYVPRISAKEAAEPDLVTHKHPQSTASEAFRSIRTSILLSRSGRELQSLVITSASPGEGKTTVVINLAVTMARAGGRVLLIDADLRRSRVHTALGLSRNRGLTTVLAGGASLEEAVQTVRLEARKDAGLTQGPLEFDVLTCGEIPPNPAELLGSPEMAALLEEARGRYTKILLDTPPLVAVTDACVLSSLIDGVFTVISMGKTSWRLIRSGLEDLEKVEAPIRGAILNSLTSAGGGYGYYDSYRYRHYRYGEESRKGDPSADSGPPDASE